MLANLLPGLRDLRAPLSAGYLWLAAGWLYFAPRLPDSVNEADGVLKDVYRVIHASSPVAVGAGLTFAAYLLGILSIGLLAWPVRRILGPLTIFALELIQGVLMFPVKLLKFLARFRRTDFDPIIDLDQGPDALYEMDFVSEYHRPEHVRARRLVIRRIVTMALGDTHYRDILLIKLDELDNAGIATCMANLRRQQRYSYAWVNDSSLDSQEKRLRLRKALIDDIEESNLISAETLVRMVVDVDRHAADIVRELGLIPERIVSDKPATYERWDRLSAEGDFRQAVVPPLLAVIAVLLARGAVSYSFGFLLTVLPLAILLQGMDKETAANAQLLQTLEADIVQVAPVQRLSTTNLYWHQSDYWIHRT